jgi:hypothetical protein
MKARKGASRSLVVVGSMAEVYVIERGARGTVVGVSGEPTTARERYDVARKPELLDQWPLHAHADAIAYFVMLDEDGDLPEFVPAPPPLERITNCSPHYDGFGTFELAPTGYTDTAGKPFRRVAIPEAASFNDWQMNRYMSGGLCLTLDEWERLLPMIGKEVTA